jgi:hypothetical protein
MGTVSLSNSQGEILEQTYFGADVVSFSYNTDEEPRLEEYRNDGDINELEIADARKQLEKTINTHLIGSGGPLGLGGWGGTEETYLQSWRLKGSEREETPDGFSMHVTVRLKEDYRGPGIIFHDIESVTRDVPMTIRWERGRVRLYQCEPPRYQPAAPMPPPPPPVEEPKEPNTPVLASLQTFLQGNIVSILSFLGIPV